MHEPPQFTLPIVIAALLGAGGLACPALGSAPEGTTGTTQTRASLPTQGAEAAGRSVVSAGLGSASLPSSEAQPTAEAPPELELRKALPIVMDGDFQPSGLLLDQGHLLTVSDKHDDALFELELGESEVRPRRFVEFEPPGDEPPPLDFEGVAQAAGGGWLVVSESRHRVLHVERRPGPTAGVGRARWLTPSLRAPAAAQGCLQVPNAGFEGVTLSPEGQLLLAIEREPRALMRLSAPDDPTSAVVQQMLGPAAGAGGVRSPDYTDLAVSRGQVYALVRNLHQIVRLEGNAPTSRQGAAHSFARAENDPRYRYRDRTYGLAEGLAVGEREVFVVLDNNGQAREADAGDRRPVLFIFERPASL